MTPALMTKMRTRTELWRALTSASAARKLCVILGGYWQAEKPTAVSRIEAQVGLSRNFEMGHLVGTTE